MRIRQWLEEAIANQYLPKIQSLKDTPSGRAELESYVKEVREEWQQRKGRNDSPLNEQKLMDETRRALKDTLSEAHWSLEIFKLSTEEYYRINSEKQHAARERQQQQIYLNNPDAIIAHAVRLLEESPKWAEVACALAVLTGRRLNEVLRTAEFTVKSQWIVTFKGALKRRDDPLVFDIPVLTTAQRIVDGLERLRKITPPDADEKAVNAASEKQFSRLVQVPGDRNSLYTHMWRSVYACIATFWYCPKQVDDMLFKAHIMGHFESLPASEQSNETVLRKRLETFSSERHYRLFEISDEIIVQHKGKRKGIKLGVSGIEPLEVFKNLPERKPMAEGDKSITTIRIFRRTMPRWNEAFKSVCPEAETQQQKMELLLEWVEQQLKHQEDASEAPLSNESVSATLPEQSPSKAESDPLREDIKSLVEASRSLTGAIHQLIQTGVPLTPPQRAAALPSRSTTEDGPTSIEPKEPQAKGTKRSTEETQQLVHTCIDALMTHNDKPDLPHEEKWAITPTILKKLGNGQIRIKEAMDQREKEIQKHHKKHQIDPNSHNLYHRRKRSIEDVIHI